MENQNQNGKRHGAFAWSGRARGGTVRTPLLLALLALILTLPGAHATRGELGVTAHDNGYEFWFEVEGVAGRNPEVRVEPGARVTVRFTNDGTSPHHFRIGPPVDDELECCVGPGGGASFTFEAPFDAGHVAYWCEPHRSLGMEGRLAVAAAPEEPSRSLPWPLAVTLAAAAAAALARKR